MHVRKNVENLEMGKKLLNILPMKYFTVDLSELFDARGPVTSIAFEPFYNFINYRKLTVMQVNLVTKDISEICPVEIHSISPQWKTLVLHLLEHPLQYY